MNLKVFDMFSGIGAFTLGMQGAGGFETIAFCEIDDYPCKLLDYNFPTIPNLGDVRNVDYTNFKCDVITGGFPCTDISIASKTREGIYGKNSILWKEYFRAIKEIRPRYCIIENVFMLLNRGLETVLQDLAEIGYDATYTTLDAKYIGTPQRRRRVYILGVRDGIPADADIFEFGRRCERTNKQLLQSFNEGFEWDFEERNGREPFAYFTRQRSDIFGECGVSSTLMKRDYKDFTDVIVAGGAVRRVTPTERLRLMGIPENWHLPSATDTLKYKYNGMHVPSVTYVASCLRNFHERL